MKKRYIASLDNGCDFSSLEFYSEHRAGSKKNREDAIKALRSKYGVNKAHRWDIVKISRYDCY